MVSRTKTSLDDFEPSKTPFTVACGCFAACRMSLV